MYLVLELDEINPDHLFCHERVKNTVMENSNFIRLVYSNEVCIFNGIFMTFKLNLTAVEPSFHKFKCLFEVKTQPEIIAKLALIEKSILNLVKINEKKPVYRITEQLTNGFLKIFNTVQCSEKNEFILKIYGIWENEVECGLTFKFLTV